MLLPPKNSVPQVINALNVSDLIIIPAAQSNKYKAIIGFICTSTIKEIVLDEENKQTNQKK